MDQYQHDQPSTTDTVEDTKVNKPPLKEDPEMRNLKEQVRDQQRQISDLQRQLKRLKNDMRVAINAFNAKNG